MNRFADHHAVHAKREADGVAYEHRAQPWAQPMTDKDWVVTLQTPMMSLLKPDGCMQFIAEGRETRIPFQGFVGPRMASENILRGKADFLPIAEDTLLWVLPNVFPRYPLKPTDTSYNRISHALRVKVQIRLEGLPEFPEQSLVLPQPHPNNWRAFGPADEQVPATTENEPENPYWLIINKEYSL